VLQLLTYIAASLAILLIYVKANEFVIGTLIALFIVFAILDLLAEGTDHDRR